MAGATGLDLRMFDRVVVPLERLEVIFRPLAAAIPLTVEPDLRFLAAEDPE